MSKLIIPKGYSPALDIYQTQTAIGILKKNFEENLCAKLNLKRVSAPLFVEAKTGLNDDLNGVERAVEFDIKETGTYAQIVHSLAKWKRTALKKYCFKLNEGLYTDMNAVRRDEEMDNLHSIYVDQWDWEKVIADKMRNFEYLKTTVADIVNAICETQNYLKKLFPALKTTLSRNVKFITTQELEDAYPTLDPKMREYEIVKLHKTVFIMQIGDILKSGVRHDGRAPDYDDWTLNGDIMFWHEILNSPIEISSMGIRVNSKSLDYQLTKSNCDNRRNLPFHKDLLENKLPLTMGGGIGQSRLSMLILEKAHIGEVQVSVWDKETLEKVSNTNIMLL